MIGVLTALQERTRCACRCSTCKCGCVDIAAGVKVAGLKGTVAACPPTAAAPCRAPPPVPGDALPSPKMKLAAAGLSGGVAAGAAAAAERPFSTVPSAGRVAKVSERPELGGDMLGVLSARLRLNTGAAVGFAGPPAAAGRTPSVRPES